MGVSDGEFKKLWSVNPSAKIVNRNQFKEISGIEVQVQGIKGGSRANANSKIWYTVFIDVDNIRSEEIPRVYILNPQESQIFHVNIFHPAWCQKKACDLPHVCWGTYHGDWQNTEKFNRTLYSLVQRLEMLLKSQNFSSPAR